jgi:hypothetical protein
VVKFVEREEAANGGRLTDFLFFSKVHMSAINMVA